MLFKIDNPCYEDWNNMEVISKSRFCSKCCKQVHDLTGNSTVDLIEMCLNNTQDSICVRTYKSQQIPTRPEIFHVIDTIQNEKFSRKNSISILMVCAILLVSCENIEKANVKEVSITECAQDSLNNQIILLGDLTEIPITGNLSLTPPPPPPPSYQDNLVEEIGDIFIDYDSSPKFPGDLIKYMEGKMKTFQFSETEIRDQLEGTVIVSMIIDKEGKIKDPVLIRNIAETKDFERRILDIVNNMPDWIPAEQNGKSIECRFILPIRVKQ